MRGFDYWAFDLGKFRGSYTLMSNFGFKYVPEGTNETNTESQLRTLNNGPRGPECLYNGVYLLKINVSARLLYTMYTAIYF